MSIADKVKEWVENFDGESFIAKDVEQAVNSVHATRTALRWLEDHKYIRRTAWKDGRVVYTKAKVPPKPDIGIRTKGRGILNVTVHRMEG